MATEKVGIYRKYYGPVPRNKDGSPLAKSQWPKKRACSWCVRWFGYDGKRYSKSFKTRKEAERFADKKQIEVQRGRADPPPQISLRDYYREHKELMEGNVAPSTLYGHLLSIEGLAATVGWQRPLDRISVKDIERFRVGRFKRGIAPSTANKDLQTLRRIFNLAIVRGYLRKGGNPCDGIPKLKVCDKQPNYIRPEEFEKLYRFTPNSFWRAFLATVYTTGLRLREATNLTWREIDFQSAQLHVTRKSKDGFVQAWTPKDHQMRSIPLSDKTLDILKVWRSDGPQGCPYVFMQQRRWKNYRRQVEAGQWKEGSDIVNNVLKRFQTLCRKTGIGPYTIHDMRRSCITNWARHLPMHVVKQLAGHSDIETTQRYYLSVQPEDISRAREVQALLLKNIPTEDLTDPKMTH